MGAVVALLAAAACGTSRKEPSMKGIKKQPFGSADLYVLTNRNGVEAAITNYGAILVSLKTPNRTGEFADIVLGFDTLDGYLGSHPYFGAVVGRYANRIGGGKFTLDGKEYKLLSSDDILAILN